MAKHNEDIPVYASTPSTSSMMSPLGFRLVLRRAPNLVYFTQTATIPTITLSEAIQPSPFTVIPRPGDKIVYEPFAMSFRVDEDMGNYLEIHNWMTALGRPDDFEEYKSLITDEEIYSDGSLIILTSNNNANLAITFEDMFPTNLSQLTYDVQQQDVEYLEAEVTFRYRRFRVESIT
jgi:hypothetical protein